VSSKLKNTAKVDTVSSKNARGRILDAALDLITERGDAAVSMAEIAEAAEVSRQALYLHFADRAALMLSLVRHVDEKRNLERELRKAREAPDAVAALRETVRLQARMNPKVWGVARGLDAVRRTDAAAERGWQDRLNHRLAGARQLVARLEEEGKLRAEIDAATAADLLWELTSLRVWEDLVLERGWSARAYEERITTLLLEALTTTGR
jgi:AcrR family transcriptional regulator